jgi:hypothetical protein
MMLPIEVQSMHRERRNSRPLVYVIVILLLSFIPAAFYRLAPERMVTPIVNLVASESYRWIIREDDYLPSLRYGDFGCRTLFLRQPEIVFAGDSHSYAGWHFPEVGPKLRARIGGCMMGGLYLESFIALLDAMRHLPPVRMVIFGASPRMFWVAPDKDEQIRSNIKALDGVVYNRQSVLDGLQNARVLPTTAQTYAQSIAAEESKIAALSETDLGQQLSASRETFATIRGWMVRLEEPPMSTDVTAQLVRTICTKIRELGTSLVVIHIPESPFIEGLYSASRWDGYVAKMSLFQECATKIIVERTAYYHLGNRHYVNREFVNSLDYGVFARKEPLTDPNYFDPDHLNRFGAIEFSNIALRTLGLRAP